jgi:hypothetical protein
MFGPCVDISGINSETDINKLDALTFELYKEAISVLNVVSHLMDESAAEKKGLPRNQAICSGLIVRIVKFMMAVAQLSQKGDRGEVVMALNRSIMESAINLEFLVCTTEEKYFDQFVEFSLGPERDLYDLIQTNIAARGGDVLPIERRMLDSINNLCSVSGWKIEDVDRKPRDWGENLRARLKALKKENMYVSSQRIPSHAVHGSWVDLFIHHLRKGAGPNVFVPRPESSDVDARLLGPVAMLVLDGAHPYLERFFSPIPETKMIQARIADLQTRLTEAGYVHEDLMNVAES